LGVLASIVGHVGDGNFHEGMMYDPKNTAQKTAVQDAAYKMVGRALEMDGTVTGEHAIGMGKMVSPSSSGTQTETNAFRLPSLMSWEATRSR
jgi:D-lactate dehydrogenase (cytochrome)